MRFQHAFKRVSLILLAAALVGGPVLSIGPATAPAIAAEASQNVFAGKVLGVSKKAKSISIEVDGNKEMVKFDDNTKGVENAEKGHAAIIEFEIRGEEKVATVIKPKLAELPPGVTEISTDDLAALIAQGPEKGRYFLVDSRPGKRYDEGHIPTAASIPVPKLKETGSTYLPSDAKLTNKLLIFYCGGPTCGMSTKSAGMAKKLGYTNIKVYLQGAPGWKKSGHTMVASTKFIEKGNLVLVDLRPAAEVERGHIPRAVNIPFEDLADAEDDFPANMSAPIVFYGNGDQAVKADKIARKWGYKTTAIVAGGYDGWVEQDKKIARGPAADEIEWVRELGPGEVSIAEFKKAIGGSGGQIILDVRNRDEAAAGKLAGAVNIPLDELEKRLSELPKDKEALVHCTTGARAEMACDVVKKAGLKARFVVANVDCTNGNCEISE